MKSLFFIICSVFLSCASVQTLTGGEKDTTPPKVIKTSVDSGSLNVTTNSFRFTFSENVTSSNINELLLVSPTQRYQPTLETKGNQGTLTLKDTLIPNTTYTVKFNGCILDVNENNPMLDYTYIFSTGSYLDSSSFGGYVKDITTNLPCKNCNVQLYTSKNDSVVVQRKPDYIAKTDEIGVYLFTNLPKQPFKLIALRDENKNLILDNDEFISLAQDLDSSLKPNDTIHIFPFRHYTDYTPILLKPKEAGVVKIALQKPLNHSIKMFLNDSLTTYRLTPSKDTILAYFAPAVDTLGVLLYIDTVPYSFIHTYPIANKKHTLDLTFSAESNLVKIHSKTRINNINSNLITLYNDSTVIPITASYFNEYNVSLSYSYSLLPNRLKIEEFAIIDVLLHNNVTSKYNILPFKNYRSNLTLTIIIDTNSYILTIYKGNTTYKTEYITSSRDLIYNNLPPGNYSCQLIRDTNKNEIWDSGDYFNNISPEHILFISPFEMRENWDKELIINSL